jgi:hypothetical protein
MGFNSAFKGLILPFSMTEIERDAEKYERKKEENAERWTEKKQTLTDVITCK